MRSSIIKFVGLAVTAFFLAAGLAHLQQDAGSSGSAAFAKITPAAGESTASEENLSFSLIDHNGKAVTEQDYTGSYKLVFFGFTTCPDVCPTTLQMIASALDLLGEDGKAIQPLLITVDPDRDTPDVMRDYVGQFSPRLIGLTGSREQIEAAQTTFHVYAEKEEGLSEDNYSMAHSGYIYLLGPDSTLMTLFRSDDTPDTLVNGVRAKIGKE